MQKKVLENSFKAAYLEFKEEPMDTNYKNLIVGYVSRLRVKKIIKELKNLHDKSLLDVGCEAGHISLKLMECGAKVVSFDVCLPALKKFKKKLDKINGDVSPFMGITQKIPLKDECMDYVVCSEVIEHVPYLDLAIREMNRVLKIGGKLIITFPNEKLRKKFYPLAKLLGINTNVEEDVTLFSYNLGNIVTKCKQFFNIKKVYSIPKILPFTYFVICIKEK